MGVKSMTPVDIDLFFCHFILHYRFASPDKYFFVLKSSSLNSQVTILFCIRNIQSSGCFSTLYQGRSHTMISEDVSV